MKRILLLMLISTSVFAADILWLPVDIPESYWSNATRKARIKNAACAFAGLPQTAEGFAQLKQSLKWGEPVTNVVGNAEHGVPAGSDWLTSNNTLDVWLGEYSVDNIRYKLTLDTNNLPTNCVIERISIDVDARVEAFRQAMILDGLVGNPTKTPKTTQEEWGVYNTNSVPIE